jgi:hypothetical protein
MVSLPIIEVVYISSLSPFLTLCFVFFWDDASFNQGNAIRTHKYATLSMKSSIFRDNGGGDEGNAVVHKKVRISMSLLKLHRVSSPFSMNIHRQRDFCFTQWFKLFIKLKTKYIFGLTEEVTERRTQNATDCSIMQEKHVELS